MRIYIPDENYQCYVVQNEGVIRAYENVPANNTTINYRDYYINSDYIYRDGIATFSQYTALPICLSDDVLTHEIYYRVDYDKILTIFLILTIFIIYIPLKIYSRLWLKRGRL